MEAIKRAALDCFYEHGYHGTSVRDIAKRANISVAGLYHHYSSKEQLLYSLMRETMDDLTADVERAIANAGQDARAKLRAAVEEHVLFHTKRQKDSFVSNSELLRSLDVEKRDAILAIRDSYEDMFRRILREGVDDGGFEPRDPKQASLAIITMCTAVATWYRASGRWSGQEVAKRYGDFVLAMMGVPRKQRPGNDYQDRNG